MGYSLKLGESLGAGTRRIALERLDHALAALDAPGDDLEKAIHDVRKDCKKSRAVLRLVRASLGGSAFRAANATVRDAARALGGLRDSHALLAAFDGAVAAAYELAGEYAVADVRGVLERCAASADDAIAHHDVRLDRARGLLEEARESVAAWPRSMKRKALRDGLATAFGQGRKRCRRARKDPAMEALHEWRKRAKDTWYHLRIFRRAAPALLEPLRAGFEDLGETLGDVHDLDALTLRLRSASDVEPGAVREALLPVAQQRRVLTERALRVGAPLYVERPRGFARRIVGSFEVARRERKATRAGRRSRRVEIRESADAHDLPASHDE